LDFLGFIRPNRAFSMGCRRKKLKNSAGPKLAWRVVGKRLKPRFSCPFPLAARRSARTRSSDSASDKAIARIRFFVNAFRTDFFLAPTTPPCPRFTQAPIASPSCGMENAAGTRDHRRSVQAGGHAPRKVRGSGAARSEQKRCERNRSVVTPLDEEGNAIRAGWVLWALIRANSCHPTTSTTAKRPYRKKIAGFELERQDASARVTAGQVRPRRAAWPLQALPIWYTRLLVIEGKSVKRFSAHLRGGPKTKEQPWRIMPKLSSISASRSRSS
jgi:hypothetical protein